MMGVVQHIERYCWAIQTEDPASRDAGLTRSAGQTDGRATKPRRQCCRRKGRNTHTCDLPDPKTCLAVANSRRVKCLPALSTLARPHAGALQSTSAITPPRVKTIDIFRWLRAPCDDGHGGGSLCAYALASNARPTANLLQSLVLEENGNDQPDD